MSWVPIFAASCALLAVVATVTRDRIDRQSLRFDLRFSLPIVTMLIVSRIS